MSLMRRFTRGASRSTLLVASLLALVVVLAILLLGAGLLALSLLLVPGLALGLLMLFVLAGALARCVLFIRVFHGGYSLGEEAGVPAGVASWGKQTPAAVTQP